MTAPTDQPQPFQIPPEHVIAALEATGQELQRENVRLRAVNAHIEQLANERITELVEKINGVQSRLTSEFAEDPETFGRISAIFDEVLAS